MNLIWRTIVHFLLSARRSRAGVFDVVRTRFRVLPTDLDVYGHMNNGRYLSIADVARIDMLRRMGLWKKMMQRGWYPVVQSATITYRRSLMPWRRFEIETAVMGFDERAVYLEQRFVCGGELYAQLFIKGRFLRRSGGTVGLDELSEAFETDVTARTLPEWVTRWADDVAMPPARHSVPSVWEDRT